MMEINIKQIDAWMGRLLEAEKTNLQMMRKLTNCLIKGTII